MSCERSMAGDEPDPCPDCAHPPLAHAAAQECLVCQMLATRDALEAYVAEAAEELRALVDRVRELLR